MNLHKNIADWICSAKVIIQEISETEFRKKDYMGEWDCYDFDTHTITIFKPKGTDEYLSLQDNVGVCRAFFNNAIKWQNVRVLDRDTNIFGITMPKNHVVLYEIATINIRKIMRYMLFAFDLDKLQIVKLYDLYGGADIKGKIDLIGSFPFKRGFNYLDGNPRKFRLAYYDGKSLNKTWIDIKMKEAKPCNEL